MQKAAITRTSTVFLQAVLILIGIGTLAGLLWEPLLEGRNAEATLFEVYFTDLFLAYVYIASIPFFVALYQAFTLLRYIGQHHVFSQDSVRALRNIKYCAVSLIAFLAGAELYIVFQSGSDDIAGGVAMGLFAMFVSLVIATAAAVFETLLQSAVDLQSENALTI